MAGLSFFVHLVGIAGTDPVVHTDKGPCPVLFWIHGGAWIIGDDIGRHGGYNGSKLALTHSAVIVAINYRLDVVGWMALRELGQEAPDGSYGNYGLHDQRSALQWVQRNVAGFGGDPERVTIFGQSAGGFSVCEHLVSPASDRLFSHAIVQSGSCSGPWLIQRGEDASAFGDAYATAVGCPPAATAPERTACLRGKTIGQVTLPWLDFICSSRSTNHSGGDPFCGNTTSRQPSLRLRAPLQRLVGRAASPPLGALGLTPTVDGTAAGLPATPTALLKAGRINRSPSGAPLSVVVGTVEDEMAMFVVMSPLLFAGASIPPVASDVGVVARRLAAYHDGWNATTAAAIESLYMKPLLHTAAYRLTQLGTDAIFRCPTRAAASALRAHGVRVHLYAFSFRIPNEYRDPNSLPCELEAEVGCGVHHAVDVPYVFGDPKDTSSASLGVSDALGQYWANLAATGDPNAAHSPHRGALAADLVPWPPYDGGTASTGQLMHIKPSGHFQVAGDELWHARCDFWDSLPPNPF